MYKRFLHITILLLLSAISPAQEYSYVHYDTRDGLAGSTVYDVCQDKEGFMWFATENGVSRYDGTHFTNFTTREGLPDNEALLLFPDSKGRVWIGTFSKFLCYYYKGKIYSKENNTLVAKLVLSNNVCYMTENKNGDVAFCDLSHIIKIVTFDNKIKLVNIGALVTNPIKFMALSSYQNDIIFTVNDSYYRYVNDSINYYYRLSKKFYLNENVTPLYRDPGKYNIGYLKLNFTPSSFTYSPSYLTYISSADGCWAVDTLNGKLSIHFLPGKKVSHTIGDNEGNTWFSTLGEGVYKLPSKEFQTYFPDNNLNPETFSIEKKDNDIFIGSGFSRLFILKNKKINKIDFSSQLKFSENKPVTNRLVTIKSLAGGTVILGFDSYLIKLLDGHIMTKFIPAIKSVCEIDKDNILIATARGAFLISIKNLNIIDTIWKGRCTRVFATRDKYYIGTLGGLFEVGKDKSFNFLGNLHPSLQRRITEIIGSPDSTIWIATNDEGIVAYKNSKIVRAFTIDSGLSSNSCKSIFLQKNNLWVGTNKGINKIDIGKTNSPIVHYTTSDGLISDMVNAVYADDSIVYACTNRGVTFFNEKSIQTMSRCVLKILKVQVSGKEMPISSNTQLPYHDNNISFDFVALSFKSDGDIIYKYQLEGIDVNWKETRENNITYFSLPYGDYTFHLMAINKFGIKSRPFNFTFSIITPWWKTPVFVIFAIIILVTLLWFAISLRYKKINKTRQEKLDFKQKIADLEQMALRAQMNPHFIFNCLSSIQSFIINGDLEKTNKYLNSFANLLRQTLELSSTKVISIANEITYITNYLELEKMRFGEKFIYKIHLGEEVPADFTFIPNMIMQPFIENSIRHGILYKTSGEGLIDISITQTITDLVCVIKDNGIGREKAAANKTIQHIEYQSKGMQLTFNRLQLINEGNREKIKTTISNLHGSEMDCGTEVKIIFPLSIIDKLNKDHD